MNKHHEGPAANVISTPGEAHQTNGCQVVDDISEEILHNEREMEAINQKQLFPSDWQERVLMVPVTYIYPHVLMFRI